MRLYLPSLALGPLPQCGTEKVLLGLSKIAVLFELCKRQNCTVGTSYAFNSLVCL